MIPVEVRDFVESIQGDLADPDMYFAGGCLQPRKCVDYDVVVIQVELDTDEILEQFAGYNIKHYAQYPDDDERHYDLIVSVDLDGTKVDFLFGKDDMDIMEVLDCFPLSIQMQAKNVKTDVVYFSGKWSGNPIHVFSVGTAVKKYKKYYPDREFIIMDKAKEVPYHLF